MIIMMLARKYFFGILFTVCSFVTCNAQSHDHVIRCGHELLDSIHATKDKHHAKHQQEFERKIEAAIAKRKSQKTTSTTEVITIPVVVHVIHDDILNSPGGPLNSNISDAQILSQIEVLNEDFRRLNPDTTNTPSAFSSVAADTYIEFCLASRDPNGDPTTGITRTYTNQGPFDISDDQTLANISYWPSDEYLNIWVCELSGGLLGFAQFPNNSGLSGLGSNNGAASTDGIVVHHSNFGNRIGTATGTSPYTYGRTTTHEVGHWLGLLHIWGSAGCLGTDHVDDTPSAFFENYGCPDGSTLNSCSSREMPENYMDYTDDQCMNIFTQGQKDRMRAVFDVSPRRKAILSSAGCCGSGLKYKLPYLEDYEMADWINASGWDTSSAVAGTLWEINNYGADSDNSLGIINHSGNSGHITYITSPIIDFSNTSIPVLEFDLAYTSAGSSMTDSIVISYESNCDGVWTTLITLSGNDLITSTKNETPLNPTDSDWQHFTFNLPELANISITKIRIENYSRGINNISIDNFAFTKTSSQLIALLYPNPGYGQLSIDLSFSGEKDVEICFYSLTGQLIFTEQRVASTSNIFNFDTSSLTNGLYLVKIISGEEEVIKKLVIENP